MRLSVNFRLDLSVFSPCSNWVNGNSIQNYYSISTGGYFARNHTGCRYSQKKEIRLWPLACPDHRANANEDQPLVSGLSNLSLSCVLSLPFHCLSVEPHKFCKVSGVFSSLVFLIIHLASRHLPNFAHAEIFKPFCVGVEIGHTTGIFIALASSIRISP